MILHTFCAPQIEPEGRQTSAKHKQSSVDQQYANHFCMHAMKIYLRPVATLGDALLAAGPVVLLLQVVQGYMRVLHLRVLCYVLHVSSLLRIGKAA